MSASTRCAGSPTDRSATFVYGSYAEANRAPTPAELACSDPDNPCLIESFLTSDPPLKQVVSHTYEAGLCGKFATFNNENVLGVDRRRLPHRER